LLFDIKNSSSLQIPGQALLSSTCHERSPSFNDYVTRQEFSHSFFTSVLSEPSFESGGSSFLVDDPNQFLLQASPSLLHQLALSVDWSAGAQTAYSAQTFPLLSHKIIVTFDTGADTHVWSLKDASRFFTEQQVSALTIVGVDNAPTRADLAGHLLILIEVPDKSRFTLDLGIAHAMQSCPTNLISVSLLIKVGAIVHFEKSNCYFQASSGATKIPFNQTNGLFQLEVERGGAHALPVSDAHSYSLHGQCFATAANLKLWQRRLRHIPKHLLARIHANNVVDGFKLKGKSTLLSPCVRC